MHYNNRRTSLSTNPQSSPITVRLTVERMTQTENRLPKWKQFWYCLKGDDKFRKQRQREAATAEVFSNKTKIISFYTFSNDFLFSESNEHGHHATRHINSVSLIDKTARIMFPASFGVLNFFYWVMYITSQEAFQWDDPPLHL